MADINLPVFSFRPNWREGVTERLSWLTDVIRAEEGVEQRRKLRQTPRRYIDADFLLRGPERTFFDLFNNRLGSNEMTVPLYWDQVELSSATVAATTARIEFDNTNREFAVGLAILMGATALDYEVVSISAVDDTGIDLIDPTVRQWPVGTLLMPLRRAIFEEISDLPHATAGIASASVRFQLTVQNPWTPAADESDVYGRYPIFDAEPNWVENLVMSYDRDIVKLDNDTGLPYQVDVMGRAAIGIAHRWFLNGRESLAGFRDLLYRHRGRAGSFWLPTFKHDLRLVNRLTASDTTIEVEAVGYRYTGGPVSGRELLAVKHDAGTKILRVLDVTAGPTSATEILELDGPVGLDLSREQVRRVSFADIARFDQDDFEIVHHGAIDGLAECNAVFRSFKDNPFILQNRGFETGTATGWSGSVSAELGGVSGAYYGYPGENAASDFYQSISVPSEWFAKIDDGDVVIDGFSAYHSTFISQPDSGQLYAAFYDAAGGLISRIESASWRSAAWTLRGLGRQDVPPLTRTIRFGAHSTRFEGVSNDNYWDDFTSPSLIWVP